MDSNTPIFFWQKMADRGRPRVDSNLRWSVNPNPNVCWRIICWRNICWSIICWKKILPTYDLFQKIFKFFQHMIFQHFSKNSQEIGSNFFIYFCSSNIWVISSNIIPPTWFLQHGCHHDTNLVPYAMNFCLEDSPFKQTTPNPSDYRQQQIQIPRPSY